MATENKKDEEQKDDKGKKTLSLSSKTLSVGGGAPKSRGGSNSVTVEVKRKRTALGGLQKRSSTGQPSGNLGDDNQNLTGLTKQEREARERALAAAKKAEEEAAKKAAEEAKRREEEDARRKEQGLPSLAEEEAAKKSQGGGPGHAPEDHEQDRAETRAGR